MTKTLTDSNLGQILTQIRSELIGLDLDRIAGNIHIRKLPWLKEAATPIGIISHRKIQPGGRGGTQTNDVRYRTVVALYLGSNENLVDDYGYSLSWEQTIRNHFHRRRRITLTTGDFALICTVDPGETIIPAKFMENYDATFLVINTLVREQRSAA